MKIGNPADKRNLAPADGAATPTKGAGKAAEKSANAAAADPSIKVQLSSGAEALRSSADADAAAFDAAKVERISQAISDGSFQANAEAIADKLITNAQELLGKVQR